MVEYFLFRYQYCLSFAGNKKWIIMDKSAIVSFKNQGMQLDNITYENNVFNLSSLNNFNAKTKQRDDFAIKFVVEGEEVYEIEKDVFKIKTNNYLLMNGCKEGNIHIATKGNTKGICINIDHSVIKEVIATICRNDTAFADWDLALFIEKDRYTESKHATKNTQLGNQLNSIKHIISSENFIHEYINKEFFFSLAENIVIDQRHIYKQLQNIPALKYHTKKDLHQRLLKGKEFMDEHFNTVVNIETIANYAAMSEFHFFRLFKTTFGLTPYQYILQERLEQAYFLLENGCGVTQTAYDCGFADVYSFSKSFKKCYGITPSSVHRN